jgi:putative holliday junction resolvase
MLLGIDYGEVRVGVALCDERFDSVAPRPLLTLTRRGRQRDLEALTRTALTHGVSLIVVGVGLAPDGGYGTRARQARNFGAELGAMAGLPVAYVDERDSSIEAAERLAALGVSTKRRGELLDPMAAAIILERYLAGCREDLRAGSLESAETQV